MSGVDPEAHILVVDDDRTTRHLTRATLVKAGYDVRVAKDGVEGLTDINQVSVKFVAMPAPPEAGQSGGTAMALSAVSPLAIGIAAAVVVIIALLLAFGSRLRGRSAVPAEPAPKRWQG